MVDRQCKGLPYLSLGNGPSAVQFGQVARTGLTSPGGPPRNGGLPDGTVFRYGNRPGFAVSTRVGIRY
jgi:hypothetical protein